MIMIRAIVRPEKSADVMQSLLEAGYPALTKVEVAGRGKQKGLRLGKIVYDILPKDMLIVVCKEYDKEFVIRAIMESARTEDGGSFGDGKIFITPVEESYTISSGEREN